MQTVRSDRSPGLVWGRVLLAPKRLDLCATGTGAAMRLHRPLTRRAQVADVMGRALLRLGVSPRAHVPVPHLEELLTMCAGDVQHLTAFRSSRGDRWIVGVADRKAIHTVIKVGRDDDEALRRECEVYRVLQPTKTVELPRILWVDERTGWLAAGLSSLEPGPAPPTLRHVAGVTAEFVGGALGTPLVHGDLTPWNTATRSNTLQVWDWEEAELGVSRPLHDLCHFVIRAGALLGRWTPRQATHELTAGGSAAGFHLDVLGLSVTDAPNYVRDYLTRTRAGDVREQRFRADILARLKGA